METLSGYSECYSALILIPGNVSYFTDQAGRRIAEALQSLGWQVQIATLNSLPKGKFDWGFLVNVSELIHSCQSTGERLLSIVRGKCRRLAQVLLECVTTHWFVKAFELGSRFGVEYVFDLGLQDQSKQLPKEVSEGYNFVFNGLIESEIKSLQSLDLSQPRPIPWAFIGHVTLPRIEIVYKLVRGFDPSGFFYLPELSVSPVTERGPHLNEEQFLRVLSKARYQIWTSHHFGTYLEGERFRASLLTGSVPLKIVFNNALAPSGTPFPYLLIQEDRLAEDLRTLDFQQIRSRFVAEFLCLPRLSASLSEVIHRIG